jgi:hypothetical protein
MEDEMFGMYSEGGRAYSTVPDRVFVKSCLSTKESEMSRVRQSDDRERGRRNSSPANTSLTPPLLPRTVPRNCEPLMEALVD